MTLIYALRNDGMSMSTTQKPLLITILFEVTK